MCQVELSTEDKLNLIKAEIKQVVAEKDIPAVSVAIVVNNNETHFLNYGKLNRESEKMVDQESIYQIASLGKSFIGIIGHNLLLENKIQLEQPITDFLSTDISKSRFKKLKQITILHLLHHCSGLPSNSKMGYKRKDGEPYIYDYSEVDLLNELKKRRVKSVGKYQYSNFGYAVLAYIFEKASNSSFDELLNKYVTEPHNMSSTSLIPKNDLKNHIVTPYRKDDRSKKTDFWKMGKMGPPSAIYSSTKDLSNLLKAQIKAYQNFENSGIPEALILSTNTTKKYPGIRYGFGFNQYGDTTFGHSGDMDGFACDYSITPSKNFGVALLTSSGENWINPLIIKINRILMK